MLELKVHNFESNLNSVSSKFDYRVNSAQLAEEHTSMKLNFKITLCVILRDKSPDKLLSLHVKQTG